MLAIRMQRTGRKGHAMFRVVVQDARRTPTSGKIVARIGSYDPHAKTVTLDKEKASFYLEHGAQPSGRVALLLKKEGVKLPEWVSLPDKKESAVRNPEKRRSTRPDEPAEEAPAEEAPAEAEANEAPAEPEAPAEEAAEKETSESSEAGDKPQADADAEPSESSKPESKETEAPDVEADKAEKAQAETSEDKPAEEPAESTEKSDEENTEKA